MAKTESFWDVPDVNSVTTPLSMIKDQADYLTEKTNGILRGSVETAGSNTRLTIELQILVPQLNNYTYTLIKYNQPMPGLYPGYLYVAPLDGGFQISNQLDFTQNFRSALKSVPVKDVLTSLISQAVS